MACKGYDSKAVKISKPVKRTAATIINAHERGEFIRFYIDATKSAARSPRKEAKEEKK